MSDSKATTIEIYFDVVSPYSWLGFEQLTRYKKPWNLNVVFKPFYLGGVMQAAQNRPPATVPAKGVYLAQDVSRLGKHFDLPIQQPSDFAALMRGTLAPMRLMAAVSLARPDKVEQVARNFWLRCWSRDQEIASEDAWRSVLKEAGIADKKEQGELIELSKSAKAKEKLKATTDEAIEAGAFGAPTLIVHMPGGEKEMFFGSDRMELIGFLLGKKWQGPNPGAVKAKL